MNRQFQGRNDSHGAKLNITPDWIKTMMLKPSFMIGVVMEKGRKGQGFLEAKIDISKEEFLKRAEMNSG
jgi:hypothetical protein